MANNDEAQKLFRQQIGIARQLLLVLEQSKTRPAELAATQACLLSLELGFIAYCRAIFNAPEISQLRDCLSQPGDSDYRQREILNLLAIEEGWLARLSRLFESLEQLPRPVDRRNDQSKATQVIASSAQILYSHWTLVDLEQLRSYLDESAALQSRHLASDEEY